MRTDPLEPVQVAYAPLPVPFFQALREIEVETSIGQASIFRLHFDLSRTMFGDFDALAIDIFQPMLPVKISIAAGTAVPQVLINGYIVNSHLKAGSAPGSSRYEVVGMDALGTRMVNDQQPFPWPNLSETEVCGAAMTAWLDRLQAESLRRAGQHSLWKQAVHGFDAGLKTQAADLFAQSTPATWTAHQAFTRRSRCAPANSSCAGI